MDDVLRIIGRENELLVSDFRNLEHDIASLVMKSSFLVVGGAGSIGQAVTKEILQFNPKLLDVVDISENNLVELVRDIRSSNVSWSNELNAFALDCSSEEFRALVGSRGPYDYIFNLSAMKHVRSEKDPFSLMRMLQTNVVNALSLYNLAEEMNSKNYFCVSTDKAANPVSLMGASKRVLEVLLSGCSDIRAFSMSRFANVAFSDGSLPHGFENRFRKRQPLAGPSDIRRYFMTSKEAARLCLISGLLGHDGEVFFPKLSAGLDETYFSDIAVRFLAREGYEAVFMDTEKEARSCVDNLAAQKKWPVYFVPSNTSGEKAYEEFYTNDEAPDFSRFSHIGVIKLPFNHQNSIANDFLENINILRSRGAWKKSELVNLIKEILPDLQHVELNRSLDQKM